jgi:protoporphyrinogen oxidase
MTIVVIGGGLAGLSAAMKLSEAGIDVTLVEKGAELGGAAASYKIGDYTIEKYYHHLFASDDTLLRLIEKLELKTKLEWRTARTGYFVDGKIYPLNTPSEIMKYPYLSFMDKARLALLVLRAKRAELSRFNNVSAADFLAKYGKRTYENFFEPLLRSKFGSGGDISAAWLLGRIKIRSTRSVEGERLGYIRGGFQQVIERMGSRIKGGIRTNCEVGRIVLDNDRVAGVDIGGEVIKCEGIISTAAPRVLNSLLGTPAVREVKYQGAACFLFGLSGKLMEDTYWLNIKGDVPFGALVEHTNFLPEDDYGENLLYVASYFQNENDIRWHLGEEELMGLYTQKLEELFPGFAAKVRWWRLARELFAGPIYEVGYTPLPYETSIRGLYTAGMFSLPNYPERSMNGSIRAGEECAERMIKCLGQ